MHLVVLVIYQNGHTVFLPGSTTGSRVRGGGMGPKKNSSTSMSCEHPHQQHSVGDNLSRAGSEEKQSSRNGHQHATASGRTLHKRFSDESSSNAVAAQDNNDMYRDANEELPGPAQRADNPENNADVVEDVPVSQPNFTLW